MSFKLGTFSIDGEAPNPGVVLPAAGGKGHSEEQGEPRVVPLPHLEPLLEKSGSPLPPGASESLLTLLDHWDESLLALGHATSTMRSKLLRLSLPINQTRVCAPVTAPRQVFCTIANYRGQILETMVNRREATRNREAIDASEASHADEVFEHLLHNFPYVSVKLPTAVSGPDDALEIPRHSESVDWEIELGVVIGHACRHVPRDEALAQVAGYLLVNDITARDCVHRTDYPALGTDWLQSKCGPGFLPTGPFLVPASFLPNPYSLHLRLAVNGQTMQDAPVSDMLFDISRQIEYLSTHAQLLPGDIICTGTPAGSGVHHGRFLQPGDVMEATCLGLGTQHIRCTEPLD